MNLPRQQLEQIVLGGGYDQVTPTLSLGPGFFRRGFNFECSINGGYTRIAGYERHDNPEFTLSEVGYQVLYAHITGPLSVGEELVGSISGAGSEVVAIIPGTNGGPSTIIVSLVNGDYEYEGEPLENPQQGWAVVANLVSYDTIATSAITDVQYRMMAENHFRDNILPVPGSGPIRGIERLKGKLYVWRDNADGDALVVHEATPVGWLPIALHHEVEFTTGTTEIKVGDIITGDTSSATAEVVGVAFESGSWTEGSAAGRLVVKDITGTFVAESITVDSVTVANITGAPEQITLLPGGRVQTVVANFAGNERRIYGCDGKNRAFEFDGTTLIPINTGMVDDTPDCIAAHKLHLFLSFDSSLQFSSINQPHSWDVVTGAGEIALNDKITVLQVLPGDQSQGALAVYTERETSVLYGFSQQSFQLTTFNVEGSGGAYPYTGGSLDQGYVLSNHGVTSLAATLNFGNFSSAALTMRIRPFVQARKHLATAATTNTEKGQYRVFFSDGTGLYITLYNGKLVGVSPVYFENPVTCICRGGNASDGTEIHYFGSDNGYVYRLGTATSFDGVPIAASVTLNFTGGKSNRQIKKYLKASVEVTGDSYAEFDFGYGLGYRSLEIEQPSVTFESTDLRPAFWDEFTWDNFVWDGRDVAPNEVVLYGSAENIAISISCDSDLFRPFTINSIILHYMNRRGLR